MDAVRRGYLGLMLFIIALVLMPLLVIDYHRQTEKDDGGVRNRALAGATATPSRGAGASSAQVDLRPAIETFQGVEDGQTLRGDVAITLITTGGVGPISYTLVGFPGQWTAESSPYLFSPQPGGWRTSQVPNGDYTLMATPINTQITPRSVHFLVQNP
ncbi:hypothetical protein [Pseudofrankia sp. DC12]|uniref:hypothetical protein n=1 Tax=Pseudofrankia sp. DC12 TaxID=683315 RepID=UPI0005F769D4|nr:hypothetical protein [Pseudofrankia sp. DC12]